MGDEGSQAHLHDSQDVYFCWISSLKHGIQIRECTNKNDDLTGKGEI